MGYSALQKLKGNISALSFKRGATLTSAERDILMGYSRFGGIKAVLYPEGKEEAWLSQGATKSDMVCMNTCNRYGSY